MSIGKHGTRCACGAWTYRKSAVCRDCDPNVAPGSKPGRPLLLPDPVIWPEDYLTRCAEELLKRHNARAEILVKLGIKEAA